MSKLGYALFDTAIGRCSLAWGEAGIVAVRLPDASDERAQARFEQRFPGIVESEPTPEIAAAIARIQGLLTGAKDDLADIVLDMGSLSDFQRAVYAIGRAIPPGETLTYGEVAKRLGDPAASRAVGEAMGKNPFPILMPCHRVQGADGKLGGFSAPGGGVTKLRLLEIEGATSVDSLPLFAR
ncbi:MAG: methylated-DNA--[protein]-cysteine S-methyltransferase [Phenylobacterium sp.]|uniref:methylated-DNA--[protein]-cysteine S-methyltransferase n=1 Tax=Phenylobacterium sp. TaxID=1871053 RepID=UPI003BB5F69A